MVPALGREERAEDLMMETWAVVAVEPVQVAAGRVGREVAGAVEVRAVRTSLEMRVLVRWAAAAVGFEKELERTAGRQSSMMLQDLSLWLRMVAERWRTIAAEAVAEDIAAMRRGAESWEMHYLVVVDMRYLEGLAAAAVGSEDRCFLLEAGWARRTLSGLGPGRTVTAAVADKCHMWTEADDMDLQLSLRWCRSSQHLMDGLRQLSGLDKGRSQVEPCWVVEYSPGCASCMSSKADPPAYGHSTERRKRVSNADREVRRACSSSRHMFVQALAEACQCSRRALEFEVHAVSYREVDAGAVLPVSRTD